jgi:hypothetical protein
LADGDRPCPNCGSENRRIQAELHEEAKATDAVTYVATASNNPVANAVFLAAQALTHPDRTLFFEERNAGEGGPVLRVRTTERLDQDLSPALRQALEATPPPARTRVAVKDAAPPEAKLQRPSKPARQAKKTPVKPTLTPGFNWLLLGVFLLTVVAFGVECLMGFAIKDSPSDMAKRLFDTADWIVKVGIGAFIGLLGGKVTK